MRLKFLITRLFFAAVIVSLVSCGDSENQAENEGVSGQANIPAVEAVEARYGSLPLSERLSGTVISRNQVEIYPEISGRISEVLVQNGQKVEEGDPIVRIDDTQYQEQVKQAQASLRINGAQLRQAQANLKELQARYNRLKSLADKELSSQQELESVEAELESAEADVELARAQVEQAQSTLDEQEEMLSRTIIRAPITGTLGQRNAERGMQVSSGTRVFTIGDLDQMRVEVVLTENMLRNIEIGQTAHIYTSNRDGTTDIAESELSRISPFLNTVTRSTEAEIDIQNTNGTLRPGMFVAVDILYGESEQATLIPTSSLYTDPSSGEEGVFVATTLGTEVEAVEDTSSESGELPPLTQPIDVEFQPVDVIAEGRMELGVEGIEPGSWIVTIGQDLLAEGRSQARVRVSSWERILALQGLQRQDLLNRILQEQES